MGKDLDRVVAKLLLAFLVIGSLVACSQPENNQSVEQATQENAEQQISAGDIDTTGR